MFVSALLIILCIPSLHYIGQPAVWTEICSQCVSLLTTLTTKLGVPDHNKVTAPVPMSVTTQPTTANGMHVKFCPVKGFN